METIFLMIDNDTQTPYELDHEEWTDEECALPENEGIFVIYHLITLRDGPVVGKCYRDEVKVTGRITQPFLEFLENRNLGSKIIDATTGDEIFNAPLC